MPKLSFLAATPREDLLYRRRANPATLRHESDAVVVAALDLLYTDLFQGRDVLWGSDIVIVPQP